MLIRSLADCQEIIAGDGCLLRELLHPDKERLDIRYSLAHATVPSGQTTKPHCLTTAEVYCILEGQGEMFIGYDSRPVGPGDIVYIPPGATQFIENTGQANLTFLCIVDPAWQPYDEEILED